MAIDFCELAKTPDRYASQNVAVRAAIFKGWLADGKSLRTFVLTESPKSANCPGFHVTVTLPTENLSALINDDSFVDFEKALHQRTAIEGSFQGYVEYQKRHKEAVSLVLQKVSALDIRRVVPVDR
jgi:hypothetical protein